MKQYVTFLLCWPIHVYKIRLISRADLFISSVIKKENIFARTCECACQPTPWYQPTTIANQCQFKFRLFFAKMNQKKDWLWYDMKANRKNELLITFFYLKRKCVQKNLRGALRKSWIVNLSAIFSLFLHFTMNWPQSSHVLLILFTRLMNWRKSVITHWKILVWLLLSNKNSSYV